jgi:hypothetical protein
VVGLLAFVATAQQFALKVISYLRQWAVQIAGYLLSTRHGYGVPPAHRRFAQQRPHPECRSVVRLLSAQRPGTGMQLGQRPNGRRAVSSSRVSCKAHASKKPTESSGAAELTAAKS